MTTRFQDRRGAASLLYRNRSEVTFFVCEQKPYSFNNPLRAFFPQIPMQPPHNLRSKFPGAKSGARINAVYPPHGTCEEESNRIRFSKLVNQTRPQEDNVLAHFTVLNEPSQSY